MLAPVGLPEPDPVPCLACLLQQLVERQALALVLRVAQEPLPTAARSIRTSSTRRLIASSTPLNDGLWLPATSRVNCGS
jgi:hypothetical protein